MGIVIQTWVPGPTGPDGGSSGLSVGGDSPGKGPGAGSGSGTGSSAGDMRETAEGGTIAPKDNDVGLSRRSSVSMDIRLSNKLGLRMGG